MKPVAPTTRGALRRHLKKHGPMNLFGITTLIEERGWKWPVQRVTQKRVRAMLESMGLHYDNLTNGWRAEPPSLEERAATFLRSLKDSKRSLNPYGHESTYSESEGYNEAIDEAIEEFNDLFPELVSNEKSQPPS